MNVNELLRQLERNPYGIRMPVTCADGFSISIQASLLHYCTPRVDDADEYTSVELGFPSSYDELIKDYADGYDYTNTVYGYVPVEVVEKLLDKHGGAVL